MSEYLPQPPAADQPWAQAGPYGYAAAPTPPMRSLKGIALAASILLGVVALVDVAAAAIFMNRASLISDVKDNPLSVSLQELLDADDAVAGITGLHLLVAVGLLVVFIIWQWRHAKNSQVLGVRGGLGPGWAIGGWFIPVANFGVLQGVQMFQSSKGSDVDARVEGRAPKGVGLVILWAIAFGLAALLFLASGGLTSTDDDGNVIIETEEDIDDAKSSDQTAAAGYGVFVIAALLGIGVVRTLTSRQTAAYQQLVAAAPVTPGAPSPPAAPAPPIAAPPPPPAPPQAPPPPPGDFQQPE